MGRTLAIHAIQGCEGRTADDFAAFDGAALLNPTGVTIVLAEMRRFSFRGLALISTHSTNSRNFIFRATLVVLPAHPILEPKAGEGSL